MAARYERITVESEEIPLGATVGQREPYSEVGQQPVVADVLVAEGRGQFVELPIEVAIRELIDLDASVVDDLKAFIGEYGFVAPISWPEMRASVENVSREIRRLQESAVHWILHKKGQDLRGVFETHLGEPMTEQETLEVLALHLDNRIEPYRPRVQVVDDGEPVLESLTLRAPPFLENALALQLSQLIQEDPRVKTCPVCHGWWVRHRGRATKGQYRRAGGVRYCSAKCASTQASRDYRARKGQAG